MYWPVATIRRYLVATTYLHKKNKEYHTSLSGGHQIIYGGHQIKNIFCSGTSGAPYISHAPDSI